MLHDDAYDGNAVRVQRSMRCGSDTQATGIKEWFEPRGLIHDGVFQKWDEREPPKNPDARRAKTEGIKDRAHDAPVYDVTSASWRLRADAFA
ncbi:hypothetical protein PPGU16_01360 [Paraburkholderia largidicola]|uniref:Uncharacterized protein n=1 Tax=Paraburkholderia largidicola TaxID=3014751 RepID=A0A7I8BF95_9BURK|nr:hypothetical protein PPGU16_01360 [Paraburkholderia sp. PGU16]